jgi:5-methyltetrahydropteroyltriglutamate--homocysteine methyltransferase
MSAPQSANQRNLSGTQPQQLLRTTVMGSYPQPAWLIDPDRLLADSVARVRTSEVWRVDPAYLHDAIQAATLMAISDQEDAGIDIITDGEIGRESYFNHFANSLGGVDQDRIGSAPNRIGGTSPVPLVTGPIHRIAPVELESAQFLRRHTTRQTKVTVPGPFTLSVLAENTYYPDQRSLAMAYAAVINAELRDLAAEGIDVVQLDEPYLQANPGKAKEFAVEAITAALDGVTAATTLHTCYGYAAYVKDKSNGYPFFEELASIPASWIAVESAQPNLDPAMVATLAPRSVVLGVLNLGSTEIERPEDIAARIRIALQHVGPEQLALSPDCGMKYLPREIAKAKLAAMVAAAEIVRAELAG